MEYLREFANHSAYAAEKNNLQKPNVATCISEDDVHYAPDEFIETRVVAVLNVTSTSTPTAILGQSTDNIAKVEIDDGTVYTSNFPSYYQFSTTGNHTVYYTLVDDTTIPMSLWLGARLKSVVLPNSVTHVNTTAFDQTPIESIDFGNSVTDISGGCGCYLCSDLSSITIPSTLIHVGYGSFVDNNFDNATKQQLLNIYNSEENKVHGAYDASETPFTSSDCTE